MSDTCPFSPPKQDWDPLDPSHHGDPTQIHKQLRETCPVAYSERFGGFYALTRFDDVVSAAQNWEIFTSAQKTPIPDATSADRPPRAPAEVDPPYHTAYRDLLNRFFEPHYIKRLEPVIRRAARDLLNRCLVQGETDIVKNFTFYMPIQVQCIFLGLSVEDAEMIKTTINGIIDAGAAGDSTTHKALNDKIYAYVYRVVAGRRATPHDPNDLISAMIYEPVDGRLLSDDDIAGTLRLFLQAGHGTTTNMLGSIIRHLGSVPADQARLREQPALIPQALEELMRVWTPVRLVGRKTTAEVEIGGRVIPQGARVGLMVASANHDADKFDDPLTVDFDRRPNPHIAFGIGHHRCIGASLAREQLRIAVEELLSLTDNITTLSEPEMSTWTHIGPAAMMVRLEPRKQQAGAIIRAGHRELIMKVARRDEVAINTVALDLVPGEGVELPTWTAGAHIDLVLPGEMIRAYSLLNAPGADNLWRIAVLREGAGRGGSVGVHRLAQGDEVRVRLPRNTFKLLPAPHYHFFASGIGITPIYAMIHEAEAHGVSWQLDYVGRHLDQMAYGAELSRFSQVKLHLTGASRRPDLQELLAQSDASVPVYACGSTGFLSALEEVCTENTRDFHTEWFSPRPGSRQATVGAYESFSVRLERSNVEVYVQPGQSIIDACSEAGVVIQGACFEGTCGSCMCGVVEGTPDHRDSFLTLKERAANKLIAPCVSKSMTPRLVLDL